MDVKKKSKRLTYLLWAFGAGVVMLIAVTSENAKRDAVQKTPTQIALERQQSSDLAVALSFLQSIKSAQKDPDAFKLHAVGTTAKGAGCVEYSGTNSFGARLRNSGVVTRDGKTALTTSDGNKFVSAWNTHCAKQPLSNDLALVEKLLAREK